MSYTILNHRFAENAKVTMLDYSGKPTGEPGNIIRLRDDKYERENNWPQNIYYYSTTFENSTYISEKYLRAI